MRDENKTIESLTARARIFRSRHLIESQVRQLGMGEVFFQSQSWKGYERACGSWHDAYWKWVDQETPVALRKKLKSIHQMDLSQLPSTSAAPAAWKVEVSCQEYLQQRVLFRLSMSGAEIHRGTGD
jgi:hypothetical protein